ncbi:unnamed protein product [Amoebophrya sp. A25]|nr:unnamed protein product [Amoebophrya sp. A25]|eukprot:GSA25T00024895001.1
MAKMKLRSVLLRSILRFSMTTRRESFLIIMIFNNKNNMGLGYILPLLEVENRQISNQSLSSLIFFSVFLTFSSVHSHSAISYHVSTTSNLCSSSFSCSVRVSNCFWQFSL